MTEKPPYEPVTDGSPSTERTTCLYGRDPKDCSACQEAEARVQSPKHVHSWQPNGLVREGMVARDPVSRSGDTLYDKVSSIAVCACGEVKKVHVANENVRQRGRT